MANPSSDVLTWRFTTPLTFVVFFSRKLNSYMLQNTSSADDNEVLLQLMSKTYLLACLLTYFTLLYFTLLTYLSADPGRRKGERARE